MLIHTHAATVYVLQSHLKTSPVTFYATMYVHMIFDVGIGWTVTDK